MAAKVLIIDKDKQTLNSLSWLMFALNLQPVVVHKWPSQIKSFRKEDLAAVFVDVELGSVNLEKVALDFADLQSRPLFLLYTRTFAPRYQQARQSQHAATFKKPLLLDDVYAALRKYIDLPDILHTQSDSHGKLAEFISFSGKFKNWLQKFEQLMNEKR